MRNSVELNMCIADVNALLTHALRDHVLMEKGYQVKEVSWVQSEMHFHITLEPATVQTVSQ